MQWLVEVGLSNALAATVLALAAWIVGTLWRRPAVTHALWLLVLLKLLTPPIIELRLPWTIPRTVAFDAAISQSPESSPKLPPTRRQQPAPNAAQTSARLPFPAIQPPTGNNRSNNDAPSPQTYVADLPDAKVIPQTAADATAPSTEISQQPARLRHPVNSSATTLWPNWRLLIAVVWIVGLTAWLALQAALGLRLRAMLRASAPASLEISKTAAEIARRLGLRRCPLVRIVAGIGSPMLCGLGTRSTILIPAALLRRLGPEAQATVLAHELAHYQRGDQWVRLIELLVTALYWWHPAVWWARQQLEIAEEQCCDAHVIAICAGQTRVYAEALLDIVDLINEPERQLRPAMTSGIGQRPALQKRLADLMQRRCAPTMTPRMRRMIVVTGAVCLVYHPTLFVTQLPKLQAASAKPSVPLLAASSASHGNKVEKLLTSRGSTGFSLNRADRTASVVPPPDLPPPPVEMVRDNWATAISPNGRYHITVSRGFQCELREVTAARVHSLSGHRITCVAFTPDSERFVTGDLQGTVRLWDAITGEMLQTLTEQDGPIHTIALTLFGDRLIAAGHEGIVELINLANPGDREVLARLNAPIRCARFSPDGSQLVLVTDSWKTGEACSVAIYDIQSGTRLLQWDINGPTGALDFLSPDRLVTVEWSGRVRAWSLPALHAVDLPALAKDLVSAASFSADTRVLEDLARYPTDHL
jgi:beta-lactamase regulating signal transducer with metallopeptidase domain